MASFNNSKYPGGGGGGGPSFDNFVIQSLMGRLQLGPSYIGTNPLLSQSLDEFLSQDDELRPDDDDERVGSPHGRGRQQSGLAREEARLEKEIIRIIRSGSALDALKPNSGQSMTIGDHSVCVGYHEEPGSEYRIWEWHGHIMLFDEENGYSPEYIYGNYFEGIPASGETKRGSGGGVSGGEDEEAKKENPGGNSGLRDLIGEQKDSASNGGGRLTVLGDVMAECRGFGEGLNLRVACIEGLAEQSRGGSARPRGVAAAALLGDLAFQWCSCRAFDARALHGAGETSCRSRRWFPDPEKAVV
ncbi:hypothetical protein Taro_043834 [Colocasia esculenta]|uniref:Uncharacterized protein n=1 Tax=Colocasia esculenta TaxID=4460 RepID=A0A843WZM0_COLES|nr:hypothetical protein [Colocasia esculenta]